MTVRSTLPLCALALCVALPAHASKKTEAANIATVTSAIDTIWNQGKVEAIDTVYADSVDTDAIRAFVKDTGERYDKMKLTIDDSFAHEDKVVVEWTASGTYKMGGTSVTVEGVTVSTVKDGKIVAENAVYDRLAVFETLQMDPFEMEAMHNEMMARKALDAAYNKGEWDGLKAMASAYKESMNGAEAAPLDTDALKARMEPWTDPKMTIDDLFARGDKVVMRWTMTGDHAALGEDASLSGIWIGRFEDGKAVEGWQVMDTAKIVQASMKN